ncbi:hypothetical protein ACFVZC_21000 [Streptomyces marokkonensis]|uniref:XRE family transcriptional regulator n=1 Tax=Streptomyces marokkonensis TaxID=324855 RepID=A0ABW6Q9G2_9ACTN
MRDNGQLDPGRAEDAGEFLAALRALKEGSGLTYRQLEERAASQGDVLPRSTLAGTLGGTALPRPELLASFVRACGDGGRTDEWLRARERIAGRAEAGPPARRGRPRLPRKAVALAVPAAVLLLVAAGAWIWASAGKEKEGGTGEPRAASPGSAAVRPSVPEGRIRVRPVLSEDLCLTDGLAPGYEPLVAVQRPCGQVAPQETTMEPLDGDAFRIRWYHPDHGPACLKALTAKPAAGLLQPWEACEQSSRFRLESAGPEGSNRYTLHADGRGCVGIRGSSTTAGAAAALEPCTGLRNQVFVIEPAP